MGHLLLMNTQQVLLQLQAPAPTTSFPWWGGVLTQWKANIGSCATPGESTGVSMALPKLNLVPSTSRAAVRGLSQRTTQHQRRTTSLLVMRMDAIARTVSNCRCNCTHPNRNVLFKYVGVT